MPRPSHITVINFIISFRNYIAPNWIFQSFWLVRTEHTICLMQCNISYHLLLYDAWWGLRGGCRPHFFTISTDRSMEIGSFHISNRLIGLIPYSPCNMPQPSHTTVISSWLPYPLIHVLLIAYSPCNMPQPSHTTVINNSYNPHFHTCSIAFSPK